MKFSISAALSVVLLPCAVKAQNVPSPTVSVTLPFEAMRLLGAPPTQSSHPLLRVTLEGGKILALPMSVDTYIAKGKAEEQSSSNGLVLRTNRDAEILVKPDLSALPKGAVIQKAEFQLYLSWRQREATSHVAAFRMLSDWGAAATYEKPFPNRDTIWNGLKAGADYLAAPLGFYETDNSKAGTISIPGMEETVRGWASGAFPNYGLVLQLSGKSGQINLDSNESTERVVPPMALGGPTDTKIVLLPNNAALQTTMLHPGDLRAASLQINLNKPPAKRDGIAVAVYKLLKPVTSEAPVAGVDYAAQPLATVDLSALPKDGWLRVPDVAGGLPNGFLLALQSEMTPRPTLLVTDTRDAKKQPQLEVSIVNYPKTLLFDNQIHPREGVYNVMRNGHFNYGGQRLRLWGTLGVARDADRLRKMGFNAWRLWREPKLYTPESAKLGEVAPVDPNAPIDEYDVFFANLKSNGMFVMFAGLTGHLPFKEIAVEGSFLAPAADAPQTEKDDWTAWCQAARVNDEGQMNSQFIYFDPRIQAARKRFARNFLNHVNPITKKRYAEDEAIAMFENFNESGFMWRVLDKGWDNWNPYFKAEFQLRWNEWLRAKYRDDAALKAAWGKLDEGETLAGNAVKLGPKSSQASQYPAARGGDFTRFINDIVIGFNLDFEKYCRSLAPAGVGVNVVPFSFDTQYIPSTQWAFQRAAGQVNCFGMYSWDTKTTLGRPPGNYVMDSHDIEGRATVIYETNQSRPDPYRTEYPFRTAALAAWQDWDGVFWHYWGAWDEYKDEDFLTTAMPQLTVAHYWTGVHHQNDPAMTTAMALAGQIFLSGAIAPAPNPTIYEVGGKALFEFNRYNSVGLTQATYSTGSRLRFKPDSDTTVTVNGGAPPDNGRIREAVKSGDEIAWDWPNERLIIDTPTAKAYIGKTASSYTFKDGITLSGFNTPFISWALVSSDGKPLTGQNAAQKVLVNGVFDARNTGFETNYEFSGGPVDQAKAIVNRGTAPVVVDEVSWTLSFPTKADTEVSAYDFALRQVSSTQTKASNVVRVKSGTAWMNALNLGTRGASATPVVDASPGAPILKAGDAVAVGRADAEKLADVFNPLPALSWGDSYSATHRLLREAPTRFVAISAEDRSNAPQKTIQWSGAEVLFGSAADFDVSFDNDRMTKIAATFVTAPDFPAAVATYEKKFGPASEKVLDKAQFETNVARWKIAAPAGVLSIVLTQSQGEVKAIYEFKAS